jgi:hemerythrin-like metal-binding protein
MNEDALRFLPLSLHIGIEEIDAQHAELFGHLVRLKRLCLNINRLPANEADALIARLRKHFATEAHYAAEAGIDFAAHTLRHQTMLEQVSKALKGASAANADVFGVLRYVEYWFERHIAHEDQELADALALRPNRRSFTEPPPATG